MAKREACHREQRVGVRPDYDGALYVCNLPKGHKPPCVLDLFWNAEAKEVAALYDAAQVAIQSMMKCKKCNVAMIPGQALRLGAVGFPDFEGDTGEEEGCTVADIGPAYMAPCLKCPLCGYSITTDIPGD